MSHNLMQEEQTQQVSTKMQHKTAAKVVQKAAKPVSNTVATDSEQKLQLDQEDTYLQLDEPVEEEDVELDAPGPVNPKLEDKGDVQLDESIEEEEDVHPDEPIDEEEVEVADEMDDEDIQLNESIREDAPGPVNPKLEDKGDVQLDEQFEDEEDV